VNESDIISIAYGPNSAVLAASIYPSPCISSSQISFTLIEDAEVEITVFDASGIVRARVLEKDYMHKGTHFARFSRGNLQPGMYFCRLESGSGQEIIKFNIAP